MNEKIKLCIEFVEFFLSKNTEKTITFHDVEDREKYAELLHKVKQVLPLKNENNDDYE